jgi:hypothetical protein
LAVEGKAQAADVHAPLLAASFEQFAKPGGRKDLEESLRAEL